MNEKNRQAFRNRIQVLSEKIRKSRDEQANICFRGMLYNKLGEYEKAIKDFDALIDLFPARGDLYYLRGHSYYAMRNFKKAKQDLLKGMSLDKTENLVDFESYKDGDFEIASEQELQSVGRVLEFEFDSAYARLGQM